MAVALESFGGPIRMTKPPNSSDEEDALVELQEGFGESVRLARKRHRMTQVELAEKCGMGQEEISRIERGILRFGRAIAALWGFATSLNLRNLIVAVGRAARPVSDLHAHGGERAFVDLNGASLG